MVSGNEENKKVIDYNLNNNNIQHNKINTNSSNVKNDSNFKNNSYYLLANKDINVFKK